LRNHRLITPQPMPRPLKPAELSSRQEAAERFKRKIEKILTEGFWFCRDCDCITEREEGEQGQPAHCGHCGSHKIQWISPVHQVQKEEA
jgi:rubrerythrin